VAELRRPVPHHDLARHPELRERRAFERAGTGKRFRC